MHNMQHVTCLCDQLVSMYCITLSITKLSLIGARQQMDTRQQMDNSMCLANSHTFINCAASKLWAAWYTTWLLI